MSTKSPSPSPNHSSGGIFRPWQMENSDSDSCQSSDSRIKPFSKCSAFSAIRKPVEYPSSTNPSLHLQQYASAGNNKPSVDFSVTSSLQEETFGKRKSNPIKKELQDLPQEIAASAANCKKDRKSFQVTSTKCPKRSLSEAFSDEDFKPKKHLRRDPTNGATLGSSMPTFSGAIPSPFLSGMPDSGTLFFSPSQMIHHSNSPFGSLVPLLEPQILIPAAEMERVCARRPRPKKFSCEECGAAFSNRGQLSGHCRIHTGERPFRCTHPSCGKRFTRNEELTRHRRIHSGLRPFACGVCPKRFGRKDHLKKHLRTHARHVLPQMQPMPQYSPLHFQQLQHFHHLQQIQQQFHLQLPLVPLQNNQRRL